jgi:hypothetical protein
VTLDADGGVDGESAAANQISAVAAATVMSTVAGRTDGRLMRLKFRPSTGQIKPSRSPEPELQPRFGGCRLESRRGYQCCVSKPAGKTGACFSDYRVEVDPVLRHELDLAGLVPPRVESPPQL